MIKVPIHVAIVSVGGGCDGLDDISLQLRHEIFPKNGDNGLPDITSIYLFNKGYQLNTAFLEAM